MASYINGTLYKWCHAIMHIEIINNTRAGIEGKIWERSYWGANQRKSNVFLEKDL